MKSLLRVTSAALLTSAVAIPAAIAQISVGGGAAAIPTPQGTLGTSGANVSGGGSISAENYGPGRVGPGSVGPGSFGPGAFGPGKFGPGAYVSGIAGPAGPTATPPKP